MHGTTENKSRTAGGVPLAAWGVAGQLTRNRIERECGRRAADGAGQDRLFLRRRQDRHVSAGLAGDRADVRRIFHSEDAEPSPPHRDDPRRQPDRHEFHRHAGRPRGLGAVFRPPRPRRLCGRSGGARPLGAFLAIAGQGRGRQSAAHRAALHRAGEIQSVAAGQAAHPMAGHGSGRRPDLRPVLRVAISLACELSEAAGAQHRGRHRAVRQDRTRRC